MEVILRRHLFHNSFEKIVFEDSTTKKKYEAGWYKSHQVNKQEP
jgi:hypothetical protein